MGLQILVETAIAIMRGQPFASPLLLIWSRTESQPAFQGLLMLSPLILYAFVSWVFAPVRESVRGDAGTTLLSNINDGKADGKTQWCVNSFTMPSAMTAGCVVKHCSLRILAYAEYLYH